jgi:hypothetical protein
MNGSGITNSWLSLKVFYPTGDRKYNPRWVVCVQVAFPVLDVP